MSREKRKIFSLHWLCRCCVGLVKRIFDVNFAITKGKKDRKVWAHLLFFFFYSNQFNLSLSLGLTTQWMGMKRKTEKFFPTRRENPRVVFFIFTPAAAHHLIALRARKKKESSRCVIKQHKSSSIHLTPCLKLIIAVIHIFFRLLLRKAFAGCRILSWIMQWKDISRWRRKEQKEKKGKRISLRRWEMNAADEKKRKTLDIFFCSNINLAGL